jgi:hypothetical protein
MEGNVGATHDAVLCASCMRDGTGVISETWALQVAVIPAKAGIHSGPPQNNRTDFLSLDKRDKIG